MAVPAGKWILRYGYRQLLIIGNVLLVLCGVLLAFLNEQSGFFYVFLAMFIQGLSFGLTSTVGIIGSQQLADAHEKGIATSFFMFCRNIGTAIGVTIMGAFLTKAASLMTGIPIVFIRFYWQHRGAIDFLFYSREQDDEGKKNLIERYKYCTRLIR